MSLEIELKYLHVDHAAVRAALIGLDAKRQGRWFEANAVFDDPARGLKASGTLLRLRETSVGSLLTLKRAAPGHEKATAKVYEELETAVADPAALAAILAGLGYEPALRYEKIREQWEVLGCEVCLDTLPFGDFLEIEGGEAAIASCARALGLPDAAASTATYHELNRRWRESSGLPPCESFVFDEDRKAALLAEIAAA